ncbi:MAG: hypothetical protein ACP5H5_06940, partial [Pyrobaculum sp.]
MELRSRAEIRGVLKIRVADVERVAYFTEVTYGGVWRGRPIISAEVSLRELGEVVRSGTIWQNQWFQDAVKIALEDKTAWFFAAFSAFDRFVYRFKLDLGMEVDKTARGTAPLGCVYADAGLPGYMWRAAYAAYRGGLEELEKWLPRRFRKRVKYVYETWKKLV